jgi:hypothetical protein
MTTTSTIVKITSTGILAALLSSKSGWATVRTADGTESKVRTGQIEEVSEKEAAKFTKMADGIKAKAEKAAAKAAKAAAKPAKEPKEPKAPKEPAAPRVAAAPHFVADKTGGEAKIAKIKNTEFDLSKYFVSDAKTPSGRRTIDVNDEVAQELRALGLDEVYAKAAEALECGVEELRTAYSHLNPGMQRMNLGNRIRGAEAAKAKAAEKARKAEVAAEKAQESAAKKAKAAEEKAAKKAAKEAAKAE